MTALKAWTAAPLFTMAIVAALSGAVHAYGGNPDSAGTAHPAATAPEVRYDTNMNGYIDSEELNWVVSAFFAGQSNREELRKLVLLNRRHDYVPPPSLLEMRDAAPWYQDGVEGEDEEWGARTLEYLTRVDATAARLASRYRWAFDKDMLEDERRALYLLFTEFEFNEQGVLVEDIVRVGTLPWMLDDTMTRSEGDVRWFVVEALAGESRPFAEKLLLREWLLDDVTPREWGIVHDLILVDGADPDMTGYLLGQIVEPIDQMDEELAGIARYLAVGSPSLGDGRADWDRLRTEPWFLDGVDSSERVFLVATSSYDVLSQHMFAPEGLFIDSKTISLPLKGDVTLWVFHEAKTRIRNSHELMTELEAAVRGAEEFVGAPFTRDHVIMVLWDTGSGGGRNYGRSVDIRLFDGDYAHPYIIHHETAHFYFGPSAPNAIWFAEGGADLIAHFVANGRNMPPIDIPTVCAAESQYKALYDLDDQPYKDHWSHCSYRMGSHFLLALRNAMGVEAFTAAVAETYDLSGFGDRGYLDEEARQLTFDIAEYLHRVFMEHTPSDRKSEALEVWRTLYGGPFIPEE